MLLTLASAVSVTVIAGLVLTGVSAEAILSAESIRRVFDHVVHGELVALGPVLLAAGVVVTLLAPLAALMAVALFGGRPRPRYVALALGVAAITAGGVVLAFG